MSVIRAAAIENKAEKEDRIQQRVKNAEDKQRTEFQGTKMIAKILEDQLEEDATEEAAFAAGETGRSDEDSGWEDEEAESGNQAKGKVSIISSALTGTLMFYTHRRKD